MLATPTPPPPYYDVSGDSFITPRDALLVINCLNRRASGGEGEGAVDGPGPIGISGWRQDFSTASRNVPHEATMRTGESMAEPAELPALESTAADAVARQRVFTVDELSTVASELDSMLDALGEYQLANWWSL